MGEIRCNHYQHRSVNSSVLKMEAAHSFKTLVPMYYVHACHIKENNNSHSHFCEELKCYMVLIASSCEGTMEC
jgi:hypothetical protein